MWAEKNKDRASYFDSKIILIKLMRENVRREKVKREKVIIGKSKKRN